MTELAGTGTFVLDAVPELVGGVSLAGRQAVLDKYPADFWLAGAFVGREPADASAT